MFKYNEVIGNIFDYEDEYVIAHCVSADLGLSTGFAGIMERRYGVRAYIKNDLVWNGKGYCVVSNNGHIYNLVVQLQEYGPFTYEALRAAMYDMFEIANRYGVEKIAMPKIGTGLAGLDWMKIKDIIFEVFGGSEIEIKVFYLKEDVNLSIEEPEIRKKDNELSKKYF